MAVGDEQGTVRISAIHGGPVTELVGHDGPAWRGYPTVVSSPADATQTLRLWDVDTGAGPKRSKRAARSLMWP